MAAPLKDLVRTMMGSREGVLPSIQAFPPLDVEQVAGELLLEQRAAEAGQRDQPPTDSMVEDAAELDIEAEVERRARKAAEDYRSQLDLYESRIRRALISTDQAVTIEASGQSALTDFKVQSIDDLNQLHLASKEVEGREQEFQSFRQRHRLSRLPTIVSHREKVGRVLVLGIFILLESILNGLFFAEGSTAGFIGGVTQALVLSILNIGAAVLYAQYGLPQIRHVSTSHKAGGMLLTVLYLAWAVLLNLAIAHFRDLYIQSNGHVPSADVWARLSTSPFLLADSQSWLLAVLGFGLSLLALIDAAGLDDPYPGYGMVGRQREEAINRYTDDKAHCLAGLTDRRDEAIVDMSKVIEFIRSAEYDLRLAIEGRQRLHRDFCGFLSHLKDARARLLRRYYEANARHRPSPPPRRFHQEPRELVALSLPVLPDLPDLQKDTRAHAISRMEYFIKAVNQQFEEVVATYRTVTGLTTVNAQETLRDLDA